MILYRWHVAVAAGAMAAGGLVLGAVLPPGAAGMPRWWADWEGIGWAQMQARPLRHIVSAVTIAGMTLWTVTTCVVGSSTRQPAAFDSPYPFPAFATCPRTPPPSTNHPGICEPAIVGPYSLLVTGVRGGFDIVGTTHNNENVVPPDQFIAVETAVTNLGASPVGLPEASAMDSSGQAEERTSSLTRPYDSVDLNAISHGQTTRVAYVFTEPGTAHLTWIAFKQYGVPATIRIWLTG